jgi:crotonobetainyl-CoA:carnitine CoA-transferase CaiB-like acyl-CoA transferase
LSASPVAVTVPPQTVGAQNREILGELGYSPTDIDALRSDGVIA